MFSSGAHSADSQWQQSGGWVLGSPWKSALRGNRTPAASVPRPLSYRNPQRSLPDVNPHGAAQTVVHWEENSTPLGLQTQTRLCENEKSFFNTHSLSKHLQSSHNHWQGLRLKVNNDRSIGKVSLLVRHPFCWGTGTNKGCDWCRKAQEEPG